MDLNKMLGQMQSMQKSLEQEQQALNNKVYTVSSNEKLVTIEMTGDRRIKDLQIDESILNPEDKEMIQDLIINTMDQALRMIDQDFASTMSKYTNGLNLPF